MRLPLQEPLQELLYFNTVSPKETVRGCVCQLSLSDDLVELHHRKLDADATARLWKKLRSALLEIQQKRPDFLVLPELSVPQALLPRLQKWSSRHGCIVIAGTHYRDDVTATVSVCPVIFPDAAELFETEKTVVSPFEKSIIAGESVQPGSRQFRFAGTEIGSFRVIICAELLDPENLIPDEANEDFIFVVSCTPDAKRFHEIIGEACKNSLYGVYICMANLKWGTHGDGRSAVFGVVDRAYLQQIHTEISDLKPAQKVWEAKSENDFVIADFNLMEKKPPLAKSVHENPNITLQASRAVIRPKGREPNRGNYRAVAFDLDGTLLRNIDYSWVTLWNHCGDDQLWRAYLKDFRSGKISYEDWCKKAVAFFKSKGLSRGDIEDVARANCRLTLGFDVGLAKLRSAGFKIAVVSGGVDTFLHALIPNFAECFDRVYINRLSYTGDGLLSGVEPTQYDFDGKARALEDFCEANGLDMSQLIYVGDTFNDDHALRAAGHAIVYADREKEIYALTANHHIIDDDFVLLADYILEITSPEFLLAFPKDSEDD